MKATTQQPGKLAPLPEKLTPRLEARIGKVEFSRGLPTQKGIDQLFSTVVWWIRYMLVHQWSIGRYSTLVSNGGFPF
jgi:hypothetical protein